VYTPGVTQPAYGFYPRTFIAALPFYFTRNESLALPLCALTRSEIEVRIQFQSLEKLVAGGYVQSTVKKVRRIDWTSLEAVSVQVDYNDLPFDRVKWFPSSQMFIFQSNSQGDTSNLYYYNDPTEKFYLATSISGFNTVMENSGMAQSVSGVTMVTQKSGTNLSGSPTNYRAAVSTSGISGAFEQVNDPKDVNGTSTIVNYIDIASDGKNFVAIGLIQGTSNYTCVDFKSPNFITPTFQVVTGEILETVTWSPGLNAFVIGASLGKMYTYTIGSASLVQIPGVVGPYTTWSRVFGQIYNVDPVAASNDIISNVYQYSFDGITWTNDSSFDPNDQYTISYSPVLDRFFVIDGELITHYSIGTPDYIRKDIYPTEVGSKFQASLPVEYVFLADEEISYIQGGKIDYVITQLQQVAINIPAGASDVNGYKLNFINPVKEMFFVIQDSSVLETNDYWNFKNTLSDDDQLVHLQLQFNGEVIISPRVADALYLGTVQFLNNHTKVPHTYFYNYSFSIDPENYLPTGQVNMSRITNQNIWMKLTDNSVSRNVRVYAKSYNILRVQNGLAGVLFIDNVSSIPEN
jgi:hypothetical protein